MVANADHGGIAQPDAAADGASQSGTAAATGADAGVHTASAENRMQDALIWIDLEMTGEVQPRRWQSLYSRSCTLGTGRASSFLVLDSRLGDVATVIRIAALGLTIAVAL